MAVSEIKDTFNSWPQYSMNTRLCPPKLRDETWSKLLKNLPGPKFRNRLYLLGRMGIWSDLSTDYDLIDVRPRLMDGWQLYPVWDKIPNSVFWKLLRNKYFPVNQNLRHPEVGDYCYLRDKFHDSVGHVPYLNTWVRDLLLHFAVKGLAVEGDPVRSKHIARIYWAIIEFGMIVEEGHVRNFGAGILSSKAESEAAFLNTNDSQRQLDYEEIINWDYDPYGIQDRHYVFEDMDQIIELINKV